MTADQSDHGPLKDEWNEVGERFGEVGRRISERYRSLAADRSPKAAEARTKLENAMKQVTAQLDQAFTSVGDALRDQEERERMGQAVRSLGSALTATFEQAVRGLRPRPGDSPGSKPEA